LQDEELLRATLARRGAAPPGATLARRGAGARLDDIPLRSPFEEIEELFEADL
jgi:hypothetical protein